MCQAKFRSTSHLGHLLLQLFHVLQHSILGLSVLQQCTHIKHIVQVCLNLHLQLVTLREPKPLSPRQKEQGEAHCEGSYQYPPSPLEPRGRGLSPRLLFVLLRYNSHTRKFIILKQMIQQHLVYSQDYATITLSHSRTFPSP